MKKIIIIAAIVVITIATVISLRETEEERVFRHWQEIHDNAYAYGE